MRTLLRLLIPAGRGPVLNNDAITALSPIDDLVLGEEATPFIPRRLSSGPQPPDDADCTSLQ